MVEEEDEERGWGREAGWCWRMLMGRLVRRRRRNNSSTAITTCSDVIYGCFLYGMRGAETAACTRVRCTYRYTMSDAKLKLNRLSRIAASSLN